MQHVHEINRREREHPQAAGTHRQPFENEFGERRQKYRVHIDKAIAFHLRGSFEQFPRPPQGPSTVILGSVAHLEGATRSQAIRAFRHIGSASKGSTIRVATADIGDSSGSSVSRPEFTAPFEDNVDELERHLRAHERKLATRVQDMEILVPSKQDIDVFNGLEIAVFHQRYTYLMCSRVVLLWCW